MLVVVEVLPQPQFTEISAADFLPHSDEKPDLLLGYS
jgi:hypothetical protein